jgi:hypothetical protein
MSIQFNGTLKALCGLTVLSLILMLGAEFALNKLSSSEAEKRLLRFIETTEPGSATSAIGLLGRNPPKKIDFICIMPPYKKRIHSPSDIDQERSEHYGKLNAILAGINYRDNALGFLLSETNWDIVYFFKGDPKPTIRSIGMNRAPLSSTPAGKQCFPGELAAFRNVLLPKYPYGRGVEFVDKE